jgi:hypothetical protein
MTPASAIDWSLIHRLSPDEWPDGVLERMDGRVIQALGLIRSQIPDSHEIIPSPVPGAHVRDTGTSRHSTAGNRLSDATDVFMAWPHVWAALQIARRTAWIGGIGLYTDMMLRGREGDYAMLHIDLRPQRLEWVAWRKSRNHPTQYVYLHADPLKYHRIIGNRASAA